MRSSLRFLTLSLTLTLGASTMLSSEASAQTSRATSQKTSTATRRAKAEPSTATRPGRTPTKSKPAPKAPEPPVRSDSVGPPNEGRLEGGIRLDLSKPYLRGVATHQSLDTRWGLPALVHAIDRAAKGVNKKFKGAVLGVGDLSKRGGGELARHNSHESGRDADLGFYLVDGQGKTVSRPTFVKINDKLRAEDGSDVRFDVARNWLFLQNLLLDPQARVSHIFVADPIKQALLAHARSRGIARGLYVRAALAMMQPTGGLPHDDHFHVRISCPSSMRKSCIEYAKNAPSKARLGKKGKQRSAMRTPAKKPPASTKPTPARTTQTHTPDRSGGIYLSKPAKAADGPDVPASLWALADAALGTTTSDPPAASRDGIEEAESDNADVKEALDDSGAPRITR